MFWWPFGSKKEDQDSKMRQDYLKLNRWELPWEECWLLAENAALATEEEEGNDL